MAVYRNSVFDHYILYLLPISFSLLAGLLGWIWRYPWGKAVVLLFMVAFFRFSIPKWPLGSLGWTVNDIQKTSLKLIAELPNNKPYSIVLLSSSHDIEGQNYRYFLSNASHQSVIIPGPVDFAQNHLADTLVIINEEKKEADPTNLPIFEIASFPHQGIEKIVEIPNGPQLIYLTRIRPDSVLESDSYSFKFVQYDSDLNTSAENQ